MRALTNLLLLFAIGLVFPISRSAMAQTQEEVLSRGRYIVTAIQGCACHTPRNPDGTYNTNLYFAGAPSDPPSVGHPATVGWTTRRWKKVYARNITPDPEAGIGKWTEADFIAAMKSGRTPDGRILDPVMPWPRFQVITDMDLKAIWAYLRTLKPIGNKVPENIAADK